MATKKEAHVGEKTLRFVFTSSHTLMEPDLGYGDAPVYTPV